MQVIIAIPFGFLAVLSLSESLLMVLELLATLKAAFLVICEPLTPKLQETIISAT